MLRYLAPSKIGLLALIELYIEGAVTNDAIIPVINFLTTHLLDCDLRGPSSTPAEQWKKGGDTIRLAVSIQRFEEVLTPFVAGDRLPGRNLWDRFLEKLWDIDSLHTLHEFFDQLLNHLAKTKKELQEMSERGEQLPNGVLLARNSPFGSFVRKAHLEFTKLQFDHVAELWKAFVKYRQPTAGYWRRRNPHYSRLSFDSVLVDGEHEWGPQTDDIAVAAYGNMLLVDGQDPTLPVSTDDIESLLEYQVEQVQRYGTRVPKNIRDQFRELVKSSRVVPSLSHYLDFAESWRSGEFPSSFDDLHRYFDYTMQSRDRLFYQYALLNLGIVQSDFGCHKEAVATMLEAIATAKENRDTACLNFALNWFFQFSLAHPNIVKDIEGNSMLGNGKELLAFLRTKAKETGMWVLWSSALLSEAKLALTSGESVSGALENMVRCSQIIVDKNVQTMLGPHFSVGIELWDRLGMTSMSSMTTEVFLRCHARNAVFDDRLRLTCRTAGVLASKGKYEEAFTKLENIDADTLRSSKQDQYHRLIRGLLKLRHDLYHNNLDSAESLLSQLLQHTPEDIDPPMVFIINTLHIEALTRRQDYEAALAKLEVLLTEHRDPNTDTTALIRLLLIKVRLFDQIGRPEKGFTIAMRAASMAWRARLVALLWQAIGALANILNALGEFVAAEQLLVAVLPRCLETDVMYDVGVLYSLLADARMGQAGEMKGRGVTGRAEMMAKVHWALDRAFESFSAVDDVNKRCEMMAKKAAIYRAEGDLVRADGCADKYLGLWEEELGRKR